MAASKKKNSLVNNINRRKKAGKSRSKSRSTVSSESYEQMEKGWPKKRAKKNAAAKKTATKKKSATKKTSTKKKSATKKPTRKKASAKNKSTRTSKR